MRKFIMASVFATLFVGFSTWAYSPEIPLSELPSLQQEPQHAVASKRIAGLFSRSHYHQFVLNKNFSEKIFTRYLDVLDFRHNVLLQSDVDNFTKFEDKFSTMLERGELAPAYQMYNLAQIRRYERFAYALSLLDKPMDFTVAGDAYYYDRKDAAWPKSEAELNELWRQRVKYDALNLMLTGKKWDEIQTILQKRYNSAIKRLTQAHSEDVFQDMMNAFARTIEPHTSYLSPRNAERFQMEMNLNLEGIGAVLQQEDDYTVIRSLVAGGPASISGKIAPEDKIIGVGQEGKPIVDVIGMRLDDVVELIKGPKNSKVILQILPKKGGSNAKPFEITIVRDKIHLEDRAATSKVIEPEDGAYAGRKMGYIHIPSFYMNLSQDVAKEIVSLKKQNIEGLIIDLRHNGGGALTEASLLTGLFIDHGPVVQIRDANGGVTQNGDNSDRVAYDGPLTVMVDRYSASASEIFAAALQDYQRALIVGEPTFGKGTVQQHKSLGRIYDMYEKPIGHVQYTIAKFYRINGGSTQLKGVTPDILFPSPLSPGDYGEAKEDNALPWDSIAAIPYRKLTDISPDLVKKLDEKYRTRIKSDVEFGYIEDDIAEFKAHNDEKSVSLVKSVRLAEREENDKKQLSRVNARRALHGEKPLAKLDEVDENAPDTPDAEDAEDKAPDAYLDETADITFDMVDLDKLANQ